MRIENLHYAEDIDRDVMDATKALGAATSLITSIIIDAASTPSVANTTLIENSPSDAVILFDPRLAECDPILKAAFRRNLQVLAVIPVSRSPSSDKIESYPTKEALHSVGIQEVYAPAQGQAFDICDCAKTLKTLEQHLNWRFRGVIPLREAAVDYSDVLAGLLGVVARNELSLSAARRDKGLMKQAVRAAGMRVCKFARLSCPNGSDVSQAMKDLQLDFPVVVKTPCGFSTMDVFICNSLEEAKERSSQIVGGIGPNSKKVLFSLLEEFIGGEEFAVNLIASPYLFSSDPDPSQPITSTCSVKATDLWMYNKVQRGGTAVNTHQTMVDPNDPKYANMIHYAQGICRAVGIHYGLAHVELKARYCEHSKAYVDPVMIEVGARLAGGRKAIMAQRTIPSWLPFEAMVDAHCGLPVQLPSTFSPSRVARQVYLPSLKSGTVLSFKGNDFERLETYENHIMHSKVGSRVKESKELSSFCAYVWLSGEKDRFEEEGLVLLLLIGNVLSCLYFPWIFILFLVSFGLISFGLVSFGLV